MVRSRRRTFFCTAIGLFLVGDTVLTSHRQTAQWLERIHFADNESSFQEQASQHNENLLAENMGTTKQSRSLQVMENSFPSTAAMTTSPRAHIALSPSQQTNRPLKNKTLVVLMGDLRCGEPCWSSLQENLLNVNQADLALLIQPPKPQYQNSSLFDMAKYHWPVPQYENWLDALDIIMDNSSDWHDSFFDQALSVMHQDNILLGPLKHYYNNTQHQFRGSAMIIFFYRYLLSQKIQELNLLQEYDWFVITRTDHYYQCPHDSVATMDPSVLYIPKGEDWLGLCDRHLVVSKERVLAALDIVPPLLRDPLQYQSVLANPRGNSEMFLKIRLMEMQLPVRRFGRSMFIGAVEGDSTLWNNATRWVPEGIKTKYPSEYKRSKGYCKWRREQENNTTTTATM